MTRHNKNPLAFDPSNAIRESVSILEEANARFALIGCLAVWTYVPDEYRRYTQDIDFAVAVEDMDKVKAVLDHNGYQTKRLPKGGYRIQIEDIIVDFLDQRYECPELFTEVAQSAKTRDLGEGLSAPVASKKHLVTMKLIRHEPKDQFDVEGLLAVTSTKSYAGLRKFAVSKLGPMGGYYLDMIARMAGHPGVTKHRR